MRTTSINDALKESEERKEAKVRPLSNSQKRGSQLYNINNKILTNK